MGERWGRSLYFGLVAGTANVKVFFRLWWCEDAPATGSLAAVAQFVVRSLLRRSVQWELLERAGRVAALTNAVQGGVFFVVVCFGTYSKPFLTPGCNYFVVLVQFSPLLPPSLPVPRGGGAASAAAPPGAAAAAGRVLGGRGPGLPGGPTAAASARGNSSPAVTGVAPGGRCASGDPGAEGRDGAGRPSPQAARPGGGGSWQTPFPAGAKPPRRGRTGQDRGWPRVAGPPAPGRGEVTGRRRGPQRPPPPGERRGRRGA